MRKERRHGLQWRQKYPHLVSLASSTSIRRADVHSWEHRRLKKIVKTLGAGGKAPSYPKNKFDLIWTVRPPYSVGVTEVSSQNCSKLDT